MFDLRDRILSYLEEHPRGKRKQDDIIFALVRDESTEEEIAAELEKMLEEEVVVLSKEKQYMTRTQAGLYEGRMSVNRYGVGFVNREVGESIRIEPADQKSAMDGDIVLVKCRPWQVYGQVVKIIRRSRAKIIGAFTEVNGKLRFIPDDVKLKDHLCRVNYDLDFTPINGMKVVCDIEKYGWPLVIRVSEVIGYKDDPGVDISSILLDHGISSKFNKEVMEQVHGISQTVLPEEIEGRKDLRSEVTITIDGDDSKDFDDAVSVIKTDTGWILKVSIADVSHYVTENSPLDIEARGRGCSTYVTDRVVPMLPHELSNGICSLNPHVDRLTLTAEMKVTPDGKVSEYEVYPSVICSTERMTYNNVNKILDGDEELLQKYQHITEMIFDLRDCADAIRASRTAKGALDFVSMESAIIVDEKGYPIDIHARERGHAEEIIEDCMIAANVTVASFMKWQEIPSIYRVHDLPVAKRLKNFVTLSEALGCKLVLGQSDVYANELQRYLSKMKDTDEYPVLSMMLLRCMSKARYDSSCTGHFGLGEDEYLHFTSPIRRYPDLIVHRMLRKYSFEHCMDEEERKKDELLVQEYAEESSINERTSQDAEYACNDMKKAEYMLDHIGEKTEGIITGVQSYGIYVTLNNTVEGLVHINDIGPDYYNYIPERMELVGEFSHVVYQLGMKVKVEVVSADKDARVVNFRLIGKNGIIRKKQTEAQKKKKQRETVKESRKKDGRRKRKQH